MPCFPLFLTTLIYFAFPLSSLTIPYSGNIDATKKTQQEKEDEDTAARMHDAFNTAKAMEQDANTAQDDSSDITDRATPKAKVQRSCGASCVIS
jgi:hypothetical protein